MRKISIFLLAIFLIMSVLMAQQRNIKVIAVNKKGESIPLYSESYALVVGISNYTNGWSYLPNAVKDAIEVKAELEKHGFHVTLLKNPTGAQLQTAIKKFIDDKGMDANNRLLFYFAGHGHSMEKTYGRMMGYIVPADAPLPSRNEKGFKQIAIDMEAFEYHARRIEAKHALFIFDSCFSGSIFVLERAMPAAISYKTSRPVRQFITAGQEDETVPDKSIFKAQLIAGLNGEADIDKDGYVTGTELGEFLQKNVLKYSRETQHPQYGKIRDDRLDKGDFVFVLPKVATEAQPPIVLPPKEPVIDTRAYELEREAKQQWQSWQTKMNNNYQKLSDLDKDANLEPASKIKFWNEFIAGYSVNNPYSPQDEELRRNAQSRVTHWQNIKIQQPVTTEAIPENMVHIPGGTFKMGSNDGEDDEKPPHDVTVNSFYMDKYEVTNAQFCEFLKEKGNQSEGGVTWLDIKDEDCKIFEQGGKFAPKTGYENHPVIEVTWYGANAYAQWAGKRLPTEAEWEYAARGGKQSRGYKYSGSNNPDEVGWYSNNSGSKTHPVGQKKSNELGLYDMSGNVWEWCADWYDSGYYQTYPSNNPKGPNTGSSRVLRGGSWGFNGVSMRVANRSINGPAVSHNDVGFRCVR